jgi:outer membrane lipoprotein-sorting protein
MSRAPVTWAAAVLLAAAAGAQTASAISASYDQTVTGDGHTVTSRVYLQDDSMRIESSMSGVQSIVIKNSEGMFTYMPEQQMAMRLAELDVQQQTVAGVDNYVEYLSGLSAERVGSETVNGYDCDVYRYNDPEGEGVTTAWVWKEHQFPVQVQVQGPKGTTLIKMSNVQVGQAHPDSLFQLPAGVQVMDMGAMMQQMMNVQE